MMQVCVKFRLGIAACLCLSALCGFGRTFDFKAQGNKGTGTKSDWWGSNANKALFGVKVGSASEADNKAEMEIRAATVMKNTNSKMTGVNDIAIFKFRPINVGKVLYFGISTGTANYARGSSWRCWQVAGCIIEIWQEGNMVKHWTNIPGNGGKTKLTGNVKQLRIDAEGNDRSGYSDYSVFDNATIICPVDQKGVKVDLDEILKEFEEQPDNENAKKADETKSASASEDDFTITTFCGFTFGSPRPDFEEKIVKMQRPFRHYDIARPQYGTRSERLIRVRLESRKRFETQEERDEAMVGVAAVFEKKYGISMRDAGGDYHFSNEHVSLWLHSSYIEVLNRDFERKEELLSKAMREASKNAAKPKASDEGADVL